MGLAAIGVASAFAFLLVYVRSPYATGQHNPPGQPVKFDHRHHVRDDGIPCLYCHDGAERGAYAGVPPTSLCMNCHSQVWTRSPEVAPVRASYFDDRPIAWARVNVLPDFVFFNHSIHVAKGVGCVSCHGRVDLMAEVHQEESLSMGFCLKCHRHPEDRLRPRDRVTDMEWKPDVPQATLGHRLVAEYGVKPTTDCTGCHR